MAVIRLPEQIRTDVHQHLFSRPGEHFAFMHARTTTSTGTPVFIVHDLTLVPDDKVTISKHGYEIDPDYLLDLVNDAIRRGDALIEAHNHRGSKPRPSPLDRDNYAEFVPYILDSLGRPYAATIWTETTVYGEYHQPDGGTGLIRSITAAGERLRQLVSRDDDGAVPPAYASRQLPWFTAAGQQQLGRLRIAIVGAGGTGSHTIMQLTFLGVRDLAIIDRDNLDQTSLNRVVTATSPADVGTNKTLLGRRFARTVAPDCQVDALPYDLRDPRSLDALKGVDVIFGCVDNDGARLILNELAVAYAIPYFDLGVGIDAPDGVLDEIGGRLAAILPGGPCLACMNEIDRAEARYHLSTPAQQEHARKRGYITGMDIPAPAVVSLNGAIASIAINELALYLTGARPISPLTQLDLLGTGRPIPSQWLTPARDVERNPGCLTCTYAGLGDAIGLERYTLA